MRRRRKVPYGIYSKCRYFRGLATGVCKQWTGLLDWGHFSVLKSCLPTLMVAYCPASTHADAGTSQLSGNTH